LGKMQREKGKRFEREAATMFREAMPDVSHEIRRGWQARSGRDAPDVIVPVFWPECKHGIKPNPRAALEQAQSGAPPGLIPVAIVKDNGQDPFVVLSAEDFFGLVKEWWARR
jgi:hypothetical protein